MVVVAAAVATAAILGGFVIPKILTPSAAPSSSSGPPSLPGPYLATFTETGLPTGTIWSVLFNGTLCLACSPLSFNGTVVSTNASSLSFELTNGSYPFLVGVPGPVLYNATISRSSPLHIQGASVGIRVTFRARCCVSTLLSPSGPPYLVTLTESGLRGGVLWSAGFNGSNLFANAMSFSYLVGESGTYHFNVTTTNGSLFPSPSSGSLVVSRSSVTPQTPWDFLGLTQFVTFSTARG